MRFRPCIDLHEGRVKQIVGGTLCTDNAVENFTSDNDAAYYARIYKRDRLNGGHVIMLGPGNREQAIKALKEFPGGMQVGGGITPENAHEFLNAGASHVIVTSYVFSDAKINFTNLKRINKTVGRERLVIDLSCRKKDGLYFVATDKWSRLTDFAINRDDINELENYCDEFLVHAADVEGLRGGVDEELITILAEMSSIPVTYAGGARDLSDVQKVFDSGKGIIDLTIGSALDIFGGNISYKELISLDIFEKA